ncbi:YbaB/EbfC family nucleoid-associated protein [Aquifex aeolicus]|uniref:YbaB/EbfC family nucleoid-associated protein n=1 Tax=Aquifex aeolicus TaxID=63363 RepID=UPI0002DF7024|nr:YbaB/EbfC family nucleoid-associated protein [Aquifex aeolicus]
MNIYDFMKQFKNFQETMEEVKRELRDEKDILEKDGVEIVFNGLGEILNIEFKGEEKDCEKLKPVLIELINQAQDIARDKVKEAFSKRFGGLLGGLGLGL